MGQASTIGLDIAKRVFQQGQRIILHESVGANVS